MDTALAGIVISVIFSGATLAHNAIGLRRKATHDDIAALRIRLDTCEERWRAVEVKNLQYLERIATMSQPLRG